MKVSEAIEKAKAVKPCVYSEETLLSFLNELEAMVQSEALGVNESEIVSYDWTEDADKTLLIPKPYDICYPSYICARVDFSDQDFESYNNQVDQFNYQYAEFKKWHRRKNDPIARLKIKNYF